MGHRNISPCAHTLFCGSHELCGCQRDGEWVFNRTTDAFLPDASQRREFRELHCEHNTHTNTHTQSSSRVCDDMCSYHVQNHQPEAQWVESLLWMHQSRVRDVEWITGLDFFQDSFRPIPELLRLKTRPTAAIRPKTWLKLMKPVHPHNVTQCFLILWIEKVWNIYSIDIENKTPLNSLFMWTKTAKSTHSLTHKQTHTTIVLNRCRIKMKMYWWKHH